MLFFGRIETEISEHCNLRCAHCSHHSPFMRPNFYPLDTFIRDVDRLCSVAEIKYFSILGGEPLLNPNIAQYLQHLRSQQRIQTLVMQTNGTLLATCDRTIFKYLDVVIVSAYLNTYCPVQKIVHTVEALKSEYPRIRFNIMVKPEFRMMDLEQPNTDTRLVKNIFRNCMMAKTCNTIYNGWFYRCVISIRKYQFLTEFLKLSPEEVPYFPAIDGVPLHEAELETRLTNYLRSDEPLQACQWCLGSSGKTIPHRQLTPSELQNPQFHNESIYNLLA